MAWFNCFIALNSFGPNLLAVSFVEGWWRGCSMALSQNKSEIWECCKRLLDGELVAASHIFILPVYIYITWKRFQAEFSTAADFLQTLGFPCVFAWDAGSGHFCSAGYLYRWSSCGMNARMYCCLLFIDCWSEIEVTGKQKCLEALEHLNRMQNSP